MSTRPIPGTIVVPRARGGLVPVLLADPPIDRIRAVFQPIVDLRTRRAVAFEALARGPEGSPLESPAALFASARAAGRLVELDEACRRTALGTAASAGLRAPLFVNVEPDALRTGGVASLQRTLDGHQGLVPVLEVTERALTARPSDLLYFLHAARALGWRIALDDVGADVRSLALMPMVRPDVVKLDMSLVQDRPSREAAAVIGAVSAECERTGALVLAEGIEDEGHFERALAMGAALGQGWLFGRPGALAADVRVQTLPALEGPVPTALRGGSAFDLVARHRGTRVAGWPLLLQISMLLEEQAAGLGREAVVVGAFQEASRFTPATAVRYAALARRASLVAALGVGLPVEPAPGVRGASLAPDDVLRGEWSVVVLGAHFSAALVARERAPEHGVRAFEYAVTHDRGLVADAAATLLHKVTALSA